MTASSTRRIVKLTNKGPADVQADLYVAPDADPQAHLPVEFLPTPRCRLLGSVTQVVIHQDVRVDVPDEDVVPAEGVLQGAQGSTEPLDPLHLGAEVIDL